MQNGLAFIRTQLAPLQAKVYRTEWEIFNPYIAGSVDLILMLPDGRLIVADWKRATKHEIHSLYKRRMKPPLNHLHDTPVAKFALQLGIYKYILENEYGFKVAGLVLAGVEPQSPFHTWVPYLKREVEWLMSTMRERRAKEVRVQFENHDLPICSGSGNVAWEPVQVNGAFFDRPFASMLHENEVQTTAVEAKATIDRLLDEVITLPSTELKELENAQKWEELIPEHGYQEFLPLSE